MFSLLAALLATPAASASVLSVRAVADPDNALRYSVHVTTSEFATVTVQWWADGDSYSTAVTARRTDTPGLRHEVAVWGLAPDTRYRFRVLVTPLSGAPYTWSGGRTFVSGSLPAGMPTFTPTTVTGSPGFGYLLLDTRATDDGRGMLVVLDNRGVVRWYQDAPSEPDRFSAALYDADAGQIYAIVDAERLVRYDLDGTITLDWWLGAELPTPIHHEIRLHDGVVYLLAARQVDIDGTEIIEDGLLGFEGSGALVSEWWAWEDGGLDPTDNAPYAWFPTGTGPWAGSFPTGNDWLHANAFDLRDEADGLKAYVSLRHTSQVAKVDLATGALEWLLGRNDTGSADAEGDYSLSPFGRSRQWWQLQHAVTLDPASGRLYLFDNGDGSGVSRGLGVSFDEATLRARIDRVVDLSDFVDHSFDGWCHSESSALPTPSGHLVVTCGTEAFVADYDASGALAWWLDIGTLDNVYRATPLPSLGY